MRSRSHLLTATVTLAAALAFLAAPAATPAPAASQCAPAGSWGTNRPELAAQVVTLINRYRASKGLRRLDVSASLTRASSWKSLHMAGYGYFAHDDPGPPVPRSAFQRARDCGFAGTGWGENIAWGYTTPQAVTQGWIGSPGHRANIENPAFTSIGVGAASANGRFYWTQAFGTGAADVRPAAARAAAIGGTPAKVGRASSGRLVASVTFVRVGTGRPLSAGEVRCRAEVAGQPLRVLASSFEGTAARCAWGIPEWASGKQLIGSVGVQVDGAAASRTFMRTVR